MAEDKSIDISLNPSTQKSLLDFGLNTGSGLVGYAFDALFGGKLADRNAAINYKWNERAAKSADLRTRALYEDYLSPASRIAQLKAAGLSPSLYADGAGGGSMGLSQGAQGEGASGVGLPTGMLQNFAQTRLMNAQADKAQAEADTLKGDTPQGEANVAATWAKAGLDKAAKELTTAQTSWQITTNEILDANKPFILRKVKAETEIQEEKATTAFWEAEEAHLDWQFNLETFEKRKEEISNAVAELAARTALEYSQQQLAVAEKNALKQQIEIALGELQVHTESAKSYGEYVDLMKKTLPRQLELRSEEIGLKKWEIGVDAINNLIRTAGYVFGATQLGDGGYETAEEVIEYDKGYGHTKSTKHVSKNRLPKRIK